MRAMAPTLLVARPGGGRHALTPPPPGVVPPAVVEALQYTAAELANDMQLRCARRGAVAQWRGPPLWASGWRPPWRPR